MIWTVYKDKNFYPEQHGPYHMTPQEKMLIHKNVYGEMVIGVENTTKELIRYLLILKNVRITVVKYNLQHAAIKYELPLTHNVPNILDKLCQVKPKGFIRVL